MENRISNLLQKLAVAFDDLENDRQNQLIYLQEENKKLKKQLFIIGSGLISIGDQLRKNLDINEIDLEQ